MTFQIPTWSNQRAWRFYWDFNRCNKQCNQISAYLARLEHFKMHIGNSSLRISSIVVICITAFANCCLQDLGNLITSKQFVGHFYIANLSNAFSHAKVLSSGVCANLIRAMVASSFSHSAEIQSLINCGILSYFVVIVAMISYSKKFGMSFVILQLYI